MRVRVGLLTYLRKIHKKIHVLNVGGAETHFVYLQQVRSKEPRSSHQYRVQKHFRLKPQDILKANGCATK